MCRNRIKKQRLRHFWGVLPMIWDVISPTCPWFATKIGLSCPWFETRSNIYSQNSSYFMLNQQKMCRNLIKKQRLRHFSHPKLVAISAFFVTLRQFINPRRLHFNHLLEKHHHSSNYEQKRLQIRDMRQQRGELLGCPGGRCRPCGTMRRNTWGRQDRKSVV